MVFMNSSTGIPLRTCTFLNTCSDFWAYACIGRTTETQRHSRKCFIRCEEASRVCRLELLLFRDPSKTAPAKSNRCLTASCTECRSQTQLESAPSRRRDAADLL